MLHLVDMLMHIEKSWVACVKRSQCLQALQRAGTDTNDPELEIPSEPRAKAPKNAANQYDGPPDHATGPNTEEGMPLGAVHWSSQYAHAMSFIAVKCERTVHQSVYIDSEACAGADGSTQNESGGNEQQHCTCSEPIQGAPNALIMQAKLKRAQDELRKRVSSITSKHIPIVNDNDEDIACMGGFF